MARIKTAKQLRKLRKQIQTARPANRKAIAVCAGTGCKAFGSFELIKAFEKSLAKHKMDKEWELRATGCHGFCERGPLVLLFPSGVLYQRVQLADVDDIVVETLKKDNILDRLLYTDPNTGDAYLKEEDIPFYRHQNRLVLKQNGFIDPGSIEDYINIGGYHGLDRALDMGSDKSLDQVVRAELRGRGGAGFPAGRKWSICREAKADQRYVVCNADEGDPGAFMDRSILEGNPHSVIEGMIIGAFVIGASEGYVYLRQEYPLAIERFGLALDQARDLGLLGKDILGSGFDFDIQINRGGGAFVCGEESALIASLEGRRGVPRRRPPYPAVEGLWGKPTNINNVETWANVPLILAKGADWFRGIGTEGSRGTKIFSLVGKVNNTGLVEVPMGMTLKEIVYDIGGGIPGGKKFKAVQTGGPSGGCLPEAKLDVPVDFDSLAAEGSMMGSGGMIVMDESTCMVDVAKYFVNFLKFESCGNCTSCRDGLERMHEILEDITSGRGTLQSIELLQEVAATVRATSLCALGTTSVNPVQSTLKYFRDEYLAHVEDKRCPAGVCKPLITFTIDADKCTGCMICARKCPQDAIEGKKKQVHRVIQDKCIKCGICHDVCKFDAVIVE
ncbi:MAG: NADH-quinone oxidoreductase subunit NuoF [Deltaproteobacteria bacterium]|nr:NADH-quinone oxidoreductase subunit NuoF [Deltaproteobacteria bacterium]